MHVSFRHTAGTPANYVVPKTVVEGQVVVVDLQQLAGQTMTCTVADLHLVHQYQGGLTVGEDGRTLTFVTATGRVVVGEMTMVDSHLVLDTNCFEEQ